MYQQNKSSKSEVKFRETSNLSLRRNLALGTFWRIANSALNKGKSATPPVFNGPKLLSSVSYKAKMFTKNLSRHSNFDNSDIFLPLFPFRTNLKLHISQLPSWLKWSELTLICRHLVQVVFLWWFQRTENLMILTEKPVFYPIQYKNLLK